MDARTRRIFSELEYECHPCERLASSVVYARVALLDNRLGFVLPVLVTIISPP